ncbi:MAG: hydantoinase B/oxoprolinase family protein [Candidatus Heimdallarchaeota archaeon]|nr:hydantoinase B/oxoprolinase family protein [Candidatus Heimdallarchaeota archaeon]
MQDNLDPISLTVLQRRLESVADEMSLVLKKTAYSPNIKERADFSCAIFDKSGDMVAQAEAIPVHLGSMPFVAKPIISKFQNWKEGDAVITNSPRSEYGGTHLPDITLVAPVFHKGEFTHVIANRAHHADVGGMTPGSLPANSTEIFQEGLIIPPVFLYKNGVENSDIMNIILENVRTPEERLGDLRAQYSSLMLGVRRMKKLMDDNPNWNIQLMQAHLQKQAEEGTRNKIATLPIKKVEYTDYLDNDGINLDEPVKIHVSIEVTSEGDLVIDFNGSDNERKGNCNAPLSVTTSACYYLLRLLTGRDVPSNSGCYKPVKIIAPEASVINPTRNSATSSANTETSSRIVDVLMGAMKQIIPWPSASQGTMNNLLIGGIHKGKPWSIYETIGGGTGAGPDGAGTSAIQSHMTNTENTPIEALELSYPLRVREYSIRRNSGGKGEFNGGDGIVRDIQLLDEATITLQSERRKFKPWSQGNAEMGKSGINKFLVPIIDNDKIKNINEYDIQILSSRITLVNAKKNSRIRILTPGGGGYNSSPEV